MKRLELFFSFAWTSYLNAVSPNRWPARSLKTGYTVKVSTKISGSKLFLIAFGKYSFVALLCTL